MVWPGQGRVEELRYKKGVQDRQRKSLKDIGGDSVCVRLSERIGHASLRERERQRAERERERAREIEREREISREREKNRERERASR